MIKTNIAVTSSGSAPAVAVIKALKRQNELRFKITGLDMNPLSSGNYLADKKIIIPASDSPGFIESIMKICRKNDIHCLVPIIDEELFIFADNKYKFEEAGIKVIANSSQTVKLAKDKYLTHQFCLREGILVPETFLACQLKKTKRLEYPLIIKPLGGRGSKDVEKINDKKELNFYKDKFEKQKMEFMVQEFIEGKEYTIDIVASRQGKILQAIPRQRIETKAGMAYKARIDKSKYLIKYGKDIAEKFNIIGPANVQCIVNKKGIFLIEVNPKFAAGLPLTVAAGVNIPLILIKIAFGLKVDKKELQFEDGLYMLRYWEEVFVPQKKIKI